MHPLTPIFAIIRYALAALLLTTIVTTSGHSSDTNLDALDGLGFSDGTEAIKKSETLAAESLVENGWDFENPNTIPGFGPMTTSSNTTGD
jgi:hypothetical protein